ncbi:MAG: NADP-dependent oxidoreductase [Desulfosarcinaceae bacterium]|nr:NADP-dependent oxidoreductase [Desulfosarcinaceae bacterium]
MKACYIEQFGDRSRLTIGELPTPQPAAGEVRIRIHAAGVNPVDWKIREGYLNDLFPHHFPLIPGWDLAGEIDSLGPDTSRFKPGDAVYAYARKPEVQHGTYAEYITLPEAYVARKPANLDMIEAASIPLTCLTAYQSLFDAGALQRGQSVFILGASGGVGSAAVQLARHRGARVAALASGRNAAYLTQLGAEKTIDYERGDFIQTFGEWMSEGVDLVYDCFGADTLARGKMCVRDGGRLVSIVDPEGGAGLAERDIQFRFVFVEPSSAQLDELREMIEAGDLKAKITATFDLDEAAKAHEMIEAGHTRGKIVLRIP